MIKRFLPFAAIAVITFAGSAPASAQVITPTSLVVSSTYFSYDDIDLINDSGLSAGLHDDNFENMWMSDSGDVTPTVTFDLGALYSVTSAQIWQYNATSIDLSRGVNGFGIYVSEDDVTYSFVTNANLAVSGGGAIAAQVVPFSADARYVRFEVTSNHGSPDYTGLSEVKFDTGPAAADAAAPATSLPATRLFGTIMASAAFAP